MTSNSDQPHHEGENTGTELAGEPSKLPLRGRLTRLKINRFRQVKPGTQLHFDDGINVLLGRNGTGKTTLLELIVAVARGDLRRYQRERFDLEFELLLSSETIVVLAQNEIGQQQGPADFISNESHNTSWSYHIQYSSRDGAIHRIDASIGSTQLSSSGAAQPGSSRETSLFLPAFYDHCIRSALSIDPLDHSGFRLQSSRFLRNLLRLDEGLDTFRSVTEGLPLSHTGFPVRMSFFSGFQWGNTNEVGRWLLEVLAHYAPPSLVGHLSKPSETAHIANEISISSPDWETLDILKDLIGAKKIQVTLQLMERTETEPGRFHSVFGKPVFRITNHRGTTFTHDQLSYGEKRLLAFMYHAAANPQILVADELVNGLHHEWIQACLDAIQGQAFLTSQNPLLLDHLPFSSGDEVQRRFILCDRDEHGDWIWRNLDQDAADAFYRAYEVGIQHVSEILETKGLW